ncbi:hypothetical protein FQZ97_1100630 [compost metagenome]
MVVVVAIAADVDHPVDGAGTAPDPPARAGNRLVGRVGLSAEAVHPVPFRVGDQTQDARRGADVAAGEQRAIARAGFDQADGNVRVGGQAIGEHAAGRTGADHYVVETARKGGHGLAPCCG